MKRFVVVLSEISNRGYVGIQSRASDSYTIGMFQKCVQYFEMYGNDAGNVFEIKSNKLFRYVYLRIMVRNVILITI